MSLMRIGRYEIKEELGRGGMATVFRAIDPRFGREVAVKILPRHYLHDPTFIARFEREAQTIATLEHPAIVPVYDFGEEDGQPFLVMRIMRGGSLVDRIKINSLLLQQVAKILTRLAPALDYAHDRAIIHRDLKPQNILFDRWEKPYLADFGIVKLVEESVTTLTASGGAVGTPAYMSPEQVSGIDELDGRSDMYALGVILFEMLTGKLPYNARTPMSLALKHITEPIPIILEANHFLPVKCQEIINRALAKDREERYQTATAMADAVSELAMGESDVPFVQAVPPVSVAAHITTPDSPEELKYESGETKPVDDARAIALAAAAIKSSLSSEAPTEQDPVSFEKFGEEDNEAAILSFYDTNTPTDVDPVPIDQSLEDETDKVAVEVGAPIAHDTPTQMDQVSGRRLEGTIANSAAAVFILSDADSDDDLSSSPPQAKSNLDKDKTASLPALLVSTWRYLALIILLLLIGVGGFYMLSAVLVRSASPSPPTPPSTIQLSATVAKVFVPPVINQATVTLASTLTARVTRTIAPSNTATQTLRPTRTPKGTAQPSPTVTTSSTPSLTNTPVATPTAVPLLLVSLPDGELKNPFNFAWSGSSGTRHRVVLRHLSENYSYTSNWLLNSNWTYDIPAEQFGAWEWYVESEFGERSTSSEFFFNPHTGSGGKPDSGYPGGNSGGRAESDKKSLPGTVSC